MVALSLLVPLVSWVTMAAGQALSFCAVAGLYDDGNGTIMVFPPNSSRMFAVSSVRNGIPLIVGDIAKPDTIADFVISASIPGFGRSNGETVLFTQDSAFVDISIIVDRSFAVVRQERITSMFGALQLTSIDKIAAAAYIPADQLTIIVAQLRRNNTDVFIQAYYGSDGFIQSATSRPGENIFAATAILFLNQSSTNNTFRVFHDQFVTTQTYPRNYRDLFRIETNRGLDFFDFRLSNEWAGCLPQLCFDGDLTAATMDGDGNALLIRARNLWLFRSQLGPEVDVPAPMQVSQFLRGSQYVDAAFIFNGTPHFIEGDTVYIGNSSGTSVRVGSAFPFLQGTTAEAALIVNERLIFITSANRHFIATYNGDTTTSTEDRNEPFVINLPIVPDALLDQPNAYLAFKGNFYYEVAKATRTAGAPRLIQGNLFTCADSFYVDIQAALHLDIRTLAEFGRYRNNFRPLDPSGSSATPVDRRTRRPNRTMSTVPTGSRLALVTTIVVVISVIIVLALFAFCMVSYRRKRRKTVSGDSDDLDRLADLTRTKEQSTHSTSMKLPAIEQSTKGFDVGTMDADKQTFASTERTVDDKFKKLFKNK